MLRTMNIAVNRRTLKLRRTLCSLMLSMLPAFTFASEYHGQILYNDLPVPGATITATQGDKQFTATADDQGAYAFTDLPGGTWKIHIEMLCFSPIDDQLTVAANQPAGKWELKMLPLPAITALANAVTVETKPAHTTVAAAPAAVNPNAATAFITALFRLCSITPRSTPGPIRSSSATRTRTCCKGETRLWNLPSVCSRFVRNSGVGPAMSWVRA